MLRGSTGRDKCLRKKPVQTKPSGTSRTSGPPTQSPPRSAFRPPVAAPPASAAAAFVTLVVLALRAPASLRLWAPLIGIAAGCVVAAPFGLYDVRPVVEAPWIGFPNYAWPGLDLSLGAEFWALLPAFVVVTVVGAIETVGDGVAIQRVSRRLPRATDFRLVQGALNADGMGNLLSGLAGTPPNTTYSTSISLAELTGVAARRVGIYIGILFVLLALSPKVTALVIAIPNPVGAAYVTVLIGLLFVQGMKLIVEDGVDHRKAAVVGLSFWLTELEFLAAAAGENLEDRLAYLSEQPEIMDEHEISFRLLRHYASSVRHQMYHDLDIVTVRVAAAS